VHSLLQRKTNKYYTNRVCVCSLRYPAFNAHEPYCHLWPVRLYYISPHYLINDTNFEKKGIENKIRVFDFSAAFVWNISYLTRIKRDIIINVHTSSSKVPVILGAFQRNDFYAQMFSKNTALSNIMKIRPVRADLFHADKQTDGTDITRLLVAFRNSRMRLTTDEPRIVGLGK